MEATTMTMTKTALRTWMNNEIGRREARRDAMVERGAEVR